MRRVAAIVVCALSLMVTAQVKADAVVHVKVRSVDNKPVDGRVELSGDGGTFTCTTSQGSCTMRSRSGASAPISTRTGSASFTRASTA